MISNSKKKLQKNPYFLKIFHLKIHFLDTKIILKFQIGLTAIDINLIIPMKTSEFGIDVIFPMQLSEFRKSLNFRNFSKKKPKIKKIHLEIDFYR